MDQLIEASGDIFEEVSKQAEEDSKGVRKVVVSSGENSSNPDEDNAKLREEEFLQVFGLILLVYGFATELVLEGLARCDFSPQGKNGDVEMDLVKDVELEVQHPGPPGQAEGQG